MITQHDVDNMKVGTRLHSAYTGCNGVTIEVPAEYRNQRVLVMVLWENDLKSISYFFEDDEFLPNRGIFILHDVD